MGNYVKSGLSKKSRLELTWVDKEKDLKIESRILIEDPDKSYGNKGSQNILIHGDNLLALKALEQEFSGRVKCIYIDPPYNSGNAFDHYDDSLEHSIWLNLMKPRITILKSLLTNDGVLFISIDDDEYAYLKVLCDEIFGRKNYCGTLIWEKKKKPSFLSNMGSVTEYILCYAKKKECSPPFIFGETTLGKKYPINNAGNGITILTFPSKSVKFNIPDQIVAPIDMSDGNIVTRLLDKVEIVNGCNLNSFRLEGEWRYSQKKINDIVASGETILISKIPFRPNHVKAGGEPKKMKNLLSVSHYNISTYEDSTQESILLFGSNAFDYPKPEKLIAILINSVTKEDDYILDSFLGSGTTAAVAHKMNRRWIGIELGDHCDTHCLPRLKMVCDGTDQGGISKPVDWKGGGGFRYYNLAPSLLRQDKYGNWIIDESYNADMLAAALAKQENFTYCPDETIYWKQGRSTEKDYIFTTTAFMTVERLDKIHEEMQPDESLLICCKSFQSECEDRFSNITIKKIPKMLLGRCEFGKDDYSLNIISMPVDPNEPEFVPQGMKNIIEGTKKKTVVNDTGDLFENGDNGGEDE